MSNFSIAKLTKDLKVTAAKHSPEILTSIGIAGMVSTVVLAVRATPKALAIIGEEEEWRRECEANKYDEVAFIEVEPLTKLEILKFTWKCYIPAAVTGVLSISCLIGASSVNVRRNAALATAYKLSETAFSEYKEKVIETIGDKKERTVRDKVAEERLKKDPVGAKEIIITSNGDSLCYDALSGQYFKSNIEAIKRAENQINSQLNREMYASLNDFYDVLELEHTKIGDELGWKIGDGLLDIDFSSHLAKDGTPCLVINYSIAPKYDYYKFA